MSVEMVRQKLLDYQCQTVLEQENALKEIAQEIALMALSRVGFFKVAAFQGGTCLRILYGLPRFSEDLDFVLEKPDNTFDWGLYVQSMRDEFSAYGYSLEVTNKSKLDKTEGGLLVLNDARTNRPLLKIKLEVDTNPPVGSGYELKYLDFPLPYSVLSQDMPSLFASKCHALLCRPYTKGRDWYDFVWYVSRQTQINFALLNGAIQQAGSWKDLRVVVKPAWFMKELKNKIDAMNWDEAKRDVAPFLRARDSVSLDVWSKAFFLSRVEKLAEYLKW